MRDHIFRKYDIRGVVGSDLSIDTVYDFGRALAFYFIKRDPKTRTIVVGMDVRTHSEAIKDELVRALIDSGLDVRFIGVCSTPVLYFSLYTLAVQAGVMITASHNDKEYNGFKICYGRNPVWGHELLRLKEFYKRKLRVSPAREGLLTRFEVIPLYLSWFEEAFVHLKKVDISAVIDCGNGAAGTVIPQLVKRMGWKNVTLLHEEIDGSFPHRAPDPTNPEHIQVLSNALRRECAEVGIGFDGDADRMVAMTDDGELVAGDRMLALFSEPLLLEHPGAGVVFDSKCSQILPALLVEWGARQIMSPTGHAIVKQKMHESGALLAGELSCHFMFNDRYFGYDDGVYAMMRLFEILHDTGETLRVLLNRLPQTYALNEVRIPCSEEHKNSVIEAVYEMFTSRSDTAVTTDDGVRVVTPYGWGIVRSSNTQPVISFRCESETRDGFERIKKDFERALAPSLQQSFLDTIECALDAQSKSFQQIG